MRVLKTFHVALTCIATAACAVALWPGPEAEARGRRFGTGVAIGVIGGIIASEALKEGPEKEKKARKAAPSGKAKARPSGQPKESASTTGGRGKAKAVGPGGTPAADAGTPVVAPGGTAAGSRGAIPGGVYAGAFGVIAAKDVVKWAEEAETRRIESEKLEAAARLESDRNVDDAVNKFIQDLQQRHTKLRGKHVSPAARGDGTNEVTDGMVRHLVEEAYKQARLDEFDPGLPETMWSRERLTVFILRQARFGIDSFYNGGGKGPSAENLRAVFLDAAREVYARALETAEVMGVSHSFDKFIGKVYLTSTGDHDGLPTLGSDGRYEKLMSSVIESVPLKALSPGMHQASAPLGLDRQFLFRFRARRALYDCVSSSYASLAKLDSTLPASVVEGDGRDSASSEAGPEAATIVTVSSEVWRRVEAHAKDVCRVTVQASVLKAAAEGDLRPQSVRADSYTAGELTPIPTSLK
jgi:hypothetical protein